MDRLQTATDASGRKDWVDFGKGISMFLVVLFHCEAYNPIRDDGLSALFAFFRMPFFFFLSGYVFTRSLQTFSLRHKLKQIARGIVWPYFVFTFILLLPKSLFYGDSALEGIRLILTGRASWFIVSLGSAQLLFALLLRFTHSQRAIAGFMLLSLCSGYAVKELHPQMLPFCFDSTLLVVFFFGLGLLFRRHEERWAGSIRASWTALLATALLYFGMICADARFLHTPPYLFTTTEYTHFPLYLLYSLTGIAMMTLFTRLVACPRPFRFIGKNSLVFYYLNGGGARAAYVLLGLFPLLRHSVACTLLASVVDCLCVSAATLLVKRYCPLLAGDKEAFNRLARKLHWNVRF